MGAHAPSCAVVGALADHLLRSSGHDLNTGFNIDPTGGRRRNTRGRVCFCFGAHLRLDDTVGSPALHRLVGCEVRFAYFCAGLASADRS